ncbi:MAG: radical SAM protein [Myxococcota bacterium]|nr:radical SAM protein [Myxococcota bacterium]
MSLDAAGPRRLARGRSTSEISGVRYVGRLYRPPSEADAYILQATIGCSWNHCTYCDMYRDKTFALRPLEECLADLDAAGEQLGDRVEKVFVADGDALVMPTDHWLAILERCRARFPRLRRVSCYAMARNVRGKTGDELVALREAGLRVLYIGPESGDDETLKRIAKGDTFAAHVEAAERAHAAGLELSVIALLGIAGERSREHAEATARLVTEMDPAYFAALTVTVVPGTPLATLQARGRFAVPAVPALLEELRTIIDLARPTDALFRTNHASNYLPLAGRLPRDRERIVAAIDAALRGEIPLRPERARGL